MLKVSHTVSNINCKIVIDIDNCLKFAYSTISWHTKFNLLIQIFFLHFLGTSLHIGLTLHKVRTKDLAILPKESKELKQYWVGLHLKAIESMPLHQ